MFENIYKPYLMEVAAIIDETPDVCSFKLIFKDEKMKERFSFKAGQFGLYSAFGEGESAFCIASSPTRKGYVECCFRKMGRVTSALQRVNIGDTIGFRGPYGNYFPIEEWEGKNLLFIGGGIALPPLRSVIWNVLDLRNNYKNITLIYGARTVQDLVYKKELEEWENRQDMRVIKTVDPGGETQDWKGKIGFVPAILKEVSPQSDNTIALVCGPSIMIKFTLPILDELGFLKKNIFTTLENKMKCGVGKCGRCNVGEVYVCKDGPVFTAEQLSTMPDEY